MPKLLAECENVKVFMKSRLSVFRHARCSLCVVRLYVCAPSVTWESYAASAALRCVAQEHVWQVTRCARGMLVLSVKSKNQNRTARGGVVTLTTAVTLKLPPTVKV